MVSPTHYLYKIWSLDPSKMVHLDVQEEKEKRLEEELEIDLDNAFDNRYAPKEELPDEGAVALAGKKSKETISATDSIIDALDIAEVELKRMTDYEVHLWFALCNFAPCNLNTGRSELFD